MTNRRIPHAAEQKREDETLREEMRRFVEDLRTIARGMSNS